MIYFCPQMKKARRLLRTGSIYNVTVIEIETRRLADPVMMVLLAVSVSVHQVAV
jgi:hypothetical protein